ncbi:thioredoxin [Copidosoma floridanum]|uniref:thioredoxin-like n=1 Tax=Copidosoma floridanum TaxID=29053 RepID=UPI0006C98E4C|nr:thioredoxin-like [Copidosoma floridanum]XP_023248254.1 thioredoxin [Copidosoma floridanum]
MSEHKVKIISNVAELEETLKNAGDKLVVIDFSATWCGPCKMIKPKYEELSLKEEMQNVIFLSVDVDEAEDVAMAYQIESMPTFVFLRDNKKLEQFSGANLDKLSDTIKKHMPQ